MELPFTKMHGLGNDFVVLNGLNMPLDLDAEVLRHIADRRLGIGCDQVLLVEAAGADSADFRYRIYNADGSEAEQCGNGVRCIARYLRDRGLARGDGVKLETVNRLISVIFDENDLLRVDMGVPDFEPAHIPLDVEARRQSYTLSVGPEKLELMAVSMGNPHAVLIVEDTDNAAVEKLGPAIQSQALFPEGVNVGFMQIIDREHVHLRVYERGAGETQACGSGACGAVAAGINAGRLDPRVFVELHGGGLIIDWAGEGQALWMTGPATTVYEGTIKL